LNGSSPEEIEPKWTGSHTGPGLCKEGRLRVAFVISLFLPRESGAERQARLQAEELARRGHSVVVYTRELENLPRSQTHFQSDSGGRVEIRRVIRTSVRGPLFGLSFVKSLVQSLVRDRKKFDIIHAHQALWESISLGLARNFLGCPILIQPASSGYDGEACELMRTKGASTLRRLAVRNRNFACISDEIRQEWQALGVASESMTKAASGVDTRWFCPSSTKPLASHSEFQAVFTGRLHQQKQIDLLIRAWPLIVKSVNGRLVIVGDGPLADELTALRDSLGLSSEQVEFQGRLHDPAQVLRQSDLFVLPSRAEGMSNSLLEAMATGLPCIVSAIGGNIDLIDHEVSGFRVQKSTPEAWAAAILEVIRNPEAARRWGQLARERVVRDFSIESVVDRNLVLYKRMMNRESGFMN
jgi:L-malate glycosyltransferase